MIGAPHITNLLLPLEKLTTHCSYHLTSSLFVYFYFCNCRSKLITPPALVADASSARPG